MATARRLAGPILGIDPGLAATGYAFLREDLSVAACGCIRTAPGPDGARLLEIVRRLGEVMEVQPAAEAALEELFMGRNRSSALGVAQARGALLAFLEERGLRVFEYKPSLVKQLLTGYGMADKAQLGRMLSLQVRGSLDGLDEHAADAIAVALCHVRSRPITAGTR
ncbi:MAG TPA: crossover junction endodeoxyribonuclease RuvC [Candidatus Acidoferrales bacterium]|nr:crossover junction endodeoxyribonuclease RuvC [Candidatus Acidoferrales bacterium]